MSKNTATTKLRKKDSFMEQFPLVIMIAPFFICILFPYYINMVEFGVSLYQ